MVLKKSSTRQAPIQPVQRGFTINVNTLIGGFVTILAGVIIWMVTSGLQASRENAKTLNKIELTLPFIDKSVSEVKDKVTNVQSEVKEASAKMVTRAESDNKQQRTESAIKEVKDDIKEVKAEQVRVNTELSRKASVPPLP